MKSLLAEREAEIVNDIRYALNMKYIEQIPNFESITPGEIDHVLEQGSNSYHPKQAVGKEEIK